MNSSILLRVFHQVMELSTHPPPQIMTFSSTSNLYMEPNCFTVLIGKIRHSFPLPFPPRGKSISPSTCVLSKLISLFIIHRNVNKELTPLWSCFATHDRRDGYFITLTHSCLSSTATTAAVGQQPLQKIPLRIGYATTRCACHLPCPFQRTRLL